jgi:hypothetical protein
MDVKTWRYPKSAVTRDSNYHYAYSDRFYIFSNKQVFAPRIQIQYLLS